MTLRPFPWREAIGFGLGVLRLSSAQFWAMTPRELACAIEAATAKTPANALTGAALPRDALNKLMKRFPDGRRPVR